MVFARIEKVESIPESTKLHKLQVFNGTETVQIMCGAPNVREGMIVCLAQIGARVCGQKISKAKLAGYESFGMCCGADELGIGSDTSGLIDVDFPVILGQDIKEVLPVCDTIFEIDNKSLTNRPDLWGHYGLAREFAVMFNRELMPLDQCDLAEYDNLKEIRINVNTDKCLRYSAISLDNITKKESSWKMKTRLCYCGMRDINLLADITNYIMLELGQPLHAFDGGKVSAINVNMAKDGDKLLTLEGEEHQIPENAIVICDQNNLPCAIAGIKGGKVASISDETSSVLFEAAVFDSATIRKASTKIGLKTDSSIRYEKSLDPENTKTALQRTIYLLKKLDNGIVVTSKFSDCYNHKYVVEPIEISEDFISNRIGMPVKQEKIVDILTKLGFSVSVDGKKIIAKVPSYRATKDISMKEDLVEEVARVIGYDNIIPQPILVDVCPVEQKRDHLAMYEVKKLLAEKYNMSEVHSYIWNYVDFNKQIGINQQSVVSLLDSSNAGQSGIRKNLVPTLLKMVSENKNTQDEIKIFEVGEVATSLNENNLVNEEKRLAVVIASPNSKEELYFELKNVLNAISKTITKTEYTLKLGDEKEEYYHLINSASVYCTDEKIGDFGLLSPNISRAIDKKLNIAIMELKFEKLFGKETEFKFKEPSKYQEVNIDFNFVVDKTKTYQEIYDLISSVRSKLVESISLVDIYEDEKLRDKKFMTVNVVLVAKDHTLEGKEIENYRNKLLSFMQQNGIELKM